MWEAQQETMTQHETMTLTACFRRPAAETPADLGKVTGERLSPWACVLMFSLAARMSPLRQAVRQAVHSPSFSSGRLSSVLSKATTTSHSTLPFLLNLALAPRTATSARNLLCPKCAMTRSQSNHCRLVNEEQDDHPSD